MGRFLRAGLAVWLAITAADASAQYPSKPIKFIVPFPPGGPTDIVGRVVAQKLSGGLGQPIIVENRPGAGGTVGTEAVSRLPGDGYTLLLGTTGTLANAPSLYPNLGYDPLKSFAPISRLTNGVFLVVVQDSVPAKNLRELIQLARSVPGQLAFGDGGNGTPPHIAGEMFKIAAGVDLLHVPYKGMGAAVTDLVAGRIQLLFEQLPALHAHIRAGKIRALAVAGSKRLPQLPEVPTTGEAGLSGYEVSGWFGLLAPTRTPRDIVMRLNGEVQRALESKEVRETFWNQGTEPVGGTPEQFAAFIGEEGAKWGRAIRMSGAKVD